MRYVKSVKSTLKGGCDVTLSRHTVLFGPNGGGKSSIVQAIELATSGWVSDMEGRDQVKKHTAIARLFPDGKPMFADVKLDDDTGFYWSMERGTKAGSFKEPVELRPVTLRWPVQEIKSVLSGEPTAVSAWLERQVAQGGSLKVELLRQLPPMLRQDAGDYIDSQAQTDFLLVAKSAKDEARRLRAAATRQENTIDGLIQGVNPPMLDSDRTRLADELEALKAVTGSTSREEYARQQQLVVELSSDYNKVKQQLAALPNPQGGALEVAKNLHGALTLLEGHQERFGDQMDCVVCGLGSAAHIQHQKARLTQGLNSLVSELNAIQLRAQLEAKEQEVKKKVEEAIQRLQSMTVAPDTSQRREQIVGLLAADAAAARAWRNAEAHRAEVTADRHRADTLAKIGAELEKAGKIVLQRKKSAFEQEVNNFLPQGDQFGIDLNTGRVGLMRDGELHSALSGAEWSRVMLALASTQPVGSTPCVLVPEDRGWDRDTLARVMRALADSPFQVIIMSTVKPDPVEGWSMVDVTE